MESEDYQRARDVKNRRAETLPGGRALGKEELTTLIKNCQNENSPAGTRDAALIGVMLCKSSGQRYPVQFRTFDDGPKH